MEEKLKIINISSIGNSLHCGHSYVGKGLGKRLYLLIGHDWYVSSINSVIKMLQTLFASNFLFFQILTLFHAHRTFIVQF